MKSVVNDVAFATRCAFTGGDCAVKGCRPGECTGRVRAHWGEGINAKVVFLVRCKRVAQDADGKNTYEVSMCHPVGSQEMADAVVQRKIEELQERGEW